LTLPAKFNKSTVQRFNPAETARPPGYLDSFEMVMRLLCAALTFPWRGPLLGSEDECGKANNMPSQKSPQMDGIDHPKWWL